MRVVRWTAAIAAAMLALVARPATAGRGLTSAAQKEQKAGQGAGRPARGQVSAISETGFEIQTRAKDAATRAVTRVTVNESTRVIEVRRGAAGDLKVDDWVAVVGEAQPDGKIAASAVASVTALAGAGQLDERLTRRVLSGSGGFLAARKPKPPAAGAPGEKKGARRPTLGKVVSVSPLKISAGGKEVEIAATGETAFAALRALTLKDLKVGDRVSVVGSITPAVEAGQPASSTAQLVIRNPGRKGAARAKSGPGAS